MRRMIGFVAAAAVVAALAAPASAQDTEWVWKTDGKRWTKVEQPAKPFAWPATKLMEVEKQEGALQGFKYVGKRMLPAYFVEVPFAAPAAQGHECTWRLAYEKKAVNKHHFCLRNGAEKPCPGMNPTGECLAKE